VLFEGIAHVITPDPLWLGSSASSEEGRGLDVGGGPMPGLSRRHCAVFCSGGSVMVEDHSSYGTYLNGRRLEGTSEVRIGDRIRLGSPGVELMLIAVAQTDV
jgi:pSer/pThr/pTyr-binding forkhead associated (FHA) protein